LSNRPPGRRFPARAHLGRCFRNAGTCGSARRWHHLRRAWSSRHPRLAHTWTASGQCARWGPLRSRDCAV